MIHTFELSMMLSKEKFEELLKTPGMRYYRRCWVTDGYADRGITKIRLYKWLREELSGKKISEENNYTHRYMVSVSVNPSSMFGGDPNLATDITVFGESFVEAIYRNIFEILPCIEQMPECYTEELGKRAKWKEVNLYSDAAFLARRIDYTFDLVRNGKLYLKLIEQGYSLRSKTYERCYYPITSNQTEKQYDVDCIPDEDDGVPLQNVYYKSSARHPSLKINIYHKQTELDNRKISGVDNSDYDFLRIEVQALKGKLTNIADRIQAPKRQLLFLATPEAEKYVLESYVTMLTGKGKIYVSGPNAKKAISAKGYTANKSAKMMEAINAVAAHHGISKTIKAIEEGRDNNFSSSASFRRYLRIIEDEVGINPVTLSQNEKGIPDVAFKENGDKSRVYYGSVVGLSHYIQAYGEAVSDEVQASKQEYEDAMIP